MKNINSVLQELKSLQPDITFVPGNNFVWSSSNKSITYINNDSPESIWALIHETAHAKLGHTSYNSDQHLLKMEVEAWHEAKALASKLDVQIDSDHIEDCLDTYRDWLHQRSSCPSCNVVTLQNNNRTYKCFNCHKSWSMPESPLCKIIKIGQPTLSSL